MVGNAEQLALPQEQLSLVNQALVLSDDQSKRDVTLVSKLSSPSILNANASASQNGLTMWKFWIIQNVSILSYSECQNSD